ncbi:MAG TPA: right-handed parallel beta-helix repeat-containing protein [Rhodanobacteraceae bacterium]|nr:right-handed parallel beta-helix repeat-containing protein [Rhodanobacteraceae bacterium]
MSFRRPLRPLAAALLITGFARAATIEVRPGDDFRGAMQNLHAGDTLIMHGGTYTLSTYFELDLTGAPAHPVTIRAAAGEQPAIHYDGDGQNIVNIVGSRFLVIDGIEFSGGSRGIRLVDTSDFTLRNCHVHDTAANAISANDAGNDYARLTFVHDEIDHAGETAEGFYLGCNDDGCRVHDSLVANNYIHDLNGPDVTQGDGIEIKAGSYANIVRDNVIHDTAYPGITLYHTNGNGAPNVIERNLVWNSGDNGIQVTGDAIVRNNIVLGAAAAGIGIHPSQGGEVAGLVIVNNTILKSSGDALHISDVAGDVLVANNALYAANGNAIFANGATDRVTLVANAGTGSLSGVSGGFDANGDIAADFGDADYSGAPPQDLVPRAGRLVGSADAATLATDDFNATPRFPALDVGAYRNDPVGNPGWPLQAGFKRLDDALFANGFDAVD